MPSLTDPTNAVGKIMLIGDQGAGKTGATAALVALGYKLLVIDTDQGFKILRSLLTDLHYPYAAYMRKHGIDPAQNISYMPIDIPMDFKTVTIKSKFGSKSYETLAPTSSEPWPNIVNLLKEWKDGDKNWGGLSDWGPDIVLSTDTISTLAEITKYWVQDLNGRMGALEDDHGRDTGGAQEMVMRYVRRLTLPNVHCNIIFNAHIRRLDMSAEAPQSVEQRLRERNEAKGTGAPIGPPLEIRGFPAIIGKSVSPFIGKLVNDVFVVQCSGEGTSVERTINTVPVDGVAAKNSVWLEPTYPISSGLGEIFYALQYKEVPPDFIREIRGGTQENANSASKGSGWGAARANR